MQVAALCRHLETVAGHENFAEAEQVVVGLSDALRAARTALAREFGTDEVRTSQP